MKQTERSYFSYSTKLKIAAYCNNTCAFPSCGKKVLSGRIKAEDLENGFSKGEFAHIVGVSPQGPRRSQDVSLESINDVSNGILLCAEHHALIDANPNDYPIETLRKWKRNIEDNYKNLLFISDYDSWDVDINNLIKTSEFIQYSEELNKFLNSSENLIVHVDGEIGVGKKTFVKYCFSQLPKNLQNEVIIIQSNDFDLSNFSLFNKMIKSRFLILLETSPNYLKKLVDRIKQVNPTSYKVISIGSGELVTKKINGIIKKYTLNRLDSKSSRKLISQLSKIISQNNIKYILDLTKGNPGIIASLVKYNERKYDFTDDSIISEIFENFNERIKKMGIELILVKKIILGFSIFSELGWYKGLYKTLFEKGKWSYEFEEIPNKFSKIINVDLDKIDIIITELLELKVLERKGRFLTLSLPCLSGLFIRQTQEVFLKYFKRIMDLQDPHLLQKFLKRLKQFAYEEVLISSIVKEILDTGLLSTIDCLNINFFSTILLNLAQLNNKLVADHLELLFKHKNPLELKEILINRRNLITALEHLIWYPETFKTGMDILIKLSIGENEDWANNATGLIPEKFRVYLPGTSASLDLRLNYLSEFIANSTEEHFFLIPMIFKSIFYLNTSSRLIYAEIQSFKPIPKEFVPNPKELSKYLNETFKIFKNQFENEKFEKDGLEIINNNLKLFVELNKFEEIKSIWNKIISKDRDFKIRLINFFEYRFKNDTIYPDIKEYINKLKEDFSLLDSIKEFSWKSPLDFKEEDMKSKSLEVKKVLSSLEKEEIQEILEWLMKNSGDFVIQIGILLSLDKDWIDQYEDVLESFLKLKENREFDFFLAVSYNIRIKDQERWRSILKKIEANEGLSHDYFRLLRATPILDDWVVNKIVDLAEHDFLNESDLYQFSCLENVIELDENLFKKIMRIYYNRFPNVISVKPQQWNDNLFLIKRYIEKNPNFIKRNVEDLLKILLNFECHEVEIGDKFSSLWLEIILIIIKECPGTIKEIRKKIISLIPSKYLPMDFDKTTINTLFINFYEIEAEDTWEDFKILFKSKSIDYVEFYFNLLFLKLVPINKILELCEENVEKNPLILVKIVGEDIQSQKGQDLVREIWYNYSNISNLSFEIYSNYTSGVKIFSPGESAKIQEFQLKRLEEWLEKEKKMEKTREKMTILINELKRLISRDEIHAKQNDEETKI